MEMHRGHVAVLQQETLQALAIRPSGIYLDGTYGRGGHSELILARLGQQGRLIAIDQDPEAVADGERRFRGDPRFSIYKTNFEQLDVVAETANVMGRVDGILLDIGVSSPQLDRPERGFSFAKDGYLDMRMNPTVGESAAQYLRRVSVEELTDVLHHYGEERYARRIARAIVEARAESPLTSTAQLAAVVQRAHPRWDYQRHPATRTFQAIRIQVNRELSVLETALAHSARILPVGGRLVVISFHSLEDRIVKRFMRGTDRQSRIPRHLPIPTDLRSPIRPLGKLTASAEEIDANPRSRSAVLRVGERVA